MLGPLRRFLQRRAGGDPDAELRFWTEQWEPHIRGGALFSPGGLELTGDTEVADSYEGRRWQEARAQVQRVLREADINDPGFFSGRVVLEIGPGPVGLPEACGASVALAVEPLADRMRDAGLLLGGDAVYLTCGAEALPLLGESVDVVVARNSLDHVRDPAAVLSETARVLRPGGTLILNVDIEGEATAEEPHAFTIEKVRALLGPLEIERERVLSEPHGHVGRQLVIVAAKPADASSPSSRLPGWTSPS
ncbi:MAG TPA: class I SAM-dependent methyltransferase [Thermoleophilaceae bacterium]|nr:class I SAM-dependent methyltransferase [Thermoleophilaceae bacterium]